MIKLNKENKILFLILGLAILLRLVAIDQSLWLDEAISAESARDFGYWQLITEFPKSDNHPPLYYFDLKFWAEIFGYGDISLRLHSVLYGILTVIVIYLIARQISKNKFYQIFSALLLATSPLHIYYSQEVRMYVMAAFLAALVMLAFIKTIKFQDEKFYWVLFSISITALIFTDYMPVFLFPVFWLVPIYLKLKKIWWRNFLLAHVPLLTIGLFWLPTFFHQAERGRWLLETLPAWREVAGGASLKQAALLWIKFVIGRISFLDKTFYAAVVFLTSIPVILSLSYSCLRRNRWLDVIWAWFAIPLALGFVASFFFPAFIYFRYVFVLPAFCLLLSWFVANLRNIKAKAFFSFIFIAINIFGWSVYVFDERQQRENWKEAVDFIEANAKETDIVLFSYPETITAYRWYASDKVEAVGATDSISPSTDKTARKLVDLIEDKQGVYYFEYLSELSDPNEIVRGFVEGVGFSKQKTYDFRGVGFVEYYSKD